MSDINKKPKRKRKGGRPPQSGAFSLLIKSGIDDLPDRRKYLRPYLTGAREGWIRDLGPTEADLTTSQKILVDRAVTFLGAIRLVEEYLSISRSAACSRTQAVSSTLIWRSITWPGIGPWWMP